MPAARLDQVVRGRSRIELRALFEFQLECSGVGYLAENSPTSRPVTKLFRVCNITEFVQGEIEPQDVDTWLA